MTRRGLIGRRAAALFCLLLLSLPITVEARSRRSLRSSLQTRLKMISRSLHTQRLKLREAKQEQRSVADRLRDVQAQLQVTREQMEEARSRLAATRRQLAALEARLRQVRASLEENYRIFGERLVRERRTGNIGYLTVALGATDFRDYLDRRRFVGRMIRSDVDLITTIQAEQAEVEEKEAQLRYQRELQASLLRELTEHEEAQKRQAWREQAILDEVNRERAQLEQALAEQEEASERVRRMLEELAQTPAGRARASAPWTGRFRPPVVGRLTSPFGYRRHPVLHVYKLHTGVDFAVPTGTPVHASAGGTVVHAGWLGAYGYAVIIDHGGGMSTLYGHNSRVTVSAGETVSAGDVIARSGSTGYSTGPHVHFEVRRAGQPVNPMY